MDPGLSPDAPRLTETSSTRTSEGIPTLPPTKEDQDRISLLANKALSSLFQRSLPEMIEKGKVSPLVLRQITSLNSNALEGIGKNPNLTSRVKIINMVPELMRCGREAIEEELATGIANPSMRWEIRNKVAEKMPLVLARIAAYEANFNQGGPEKIAKALAEANFARESQGNSVDILKAFLITIDLEIPLNRHQALKNLRWARIFITSLLSGTEKISILLELAKLVGKLQPDGVMSTLEEAKVVARSFNFDDLQKAEPLCRIATMEIEIGSPRAEETISEVKRIAETFGELDTYSHAILLSMVAVVEEKMKSPLALDTLNAAKEMVGRSLDSIPHQKAMFLYRIAKVELKHNPEETMIALNEAKEVAMDIKDNKEKATMLFKLAEIEGEISPDQAKETLERVKNVLKEMTTETPIKEWNLPSIAQILFKIAMLQIKLSPANAVITMQEAIDTAKLISGEWGSMKAFLLTDFAMRIMYSETEAPFDY